MEGDIFCCIHKGDELVKCANGTIEYKGGQTNCIFVNRNTSKVDFISKLWPKFNQIGFHNEFDPLYQLSFHDDAVVVKMLKVNMFCCVYISLCTKVATTLIILTKYIWPTTSVFLFSNNFSNICR